MKTFNLLNSLRLGLLLALFCSVTLPSMAGAAPLALPPTSPITGYIPQGQTSPIPDYYTTPNWANSPPIAKFVDTLPGLTPAGINNLGQYLPVAQPDTTTFPGSDYYVIKLVQYSEKLHSDLNPTLMRAYVQLHPVTGAQIGDPHYLGPIIVATKDRPVRLKFINGLPTGAGGDLFIPVDESVMGAGEGPIPGEKYTQNRADLHLHGGRTPWISDGTPHQWIVPAGEATPYLQGVSMQNVPDMCFDQTTYQAIPRSVDPDCLTGGSNPGPGASTYYWTNQQSTRLMFYHDHAWGITRLNVYVGEAAGYVITDQHEQDLVDRGVIPGSKTGTGTSYGGMIPLVLQDKTFVNADVKFHPATGQHEMTIRETDPLWNWGRCDEKINGVCTPVTGDLWLPHVYMPAQQPTGSVTGGVNPFGRWMYGPWFYPATNVTHGPVDNPYYDPDCSSSNPVILAQCQTPGQPPLIPGTPSVSMGMEAFQDSAVVNGTAFPTVTVDPTAYRFRILNAASDRFFNLSFYIADADPANSSPDTRLTTAGPDGRGYLRSKRTEVKMAPASAAVAAANNWPVDWPTDGRTEMVPDPGVCQPGGVNCPNLGPNFIQIGTEGGFLPFPAVRTPQPVTYITDPTAFWVGVVDKTGLALGPAERADVIVDFSKYAGKTLILYNDAPAAWPARVPGYDYYTNAPDMRDSGGYGTGGTFNEITGAWEGGTGPLPGYAPNTRTVMQVIVRDGQGSSFDMVKLENEFTSAAEPTSLNPAPVKTLFERTQEPIIVGQAAYSSAYPNSYFPTNFPWEGVNQINDHFLQFVTLAGEEVSKTTEPRGIHDEMGASFDPEYGRMSGNLAMQLPNPTTLNAVLILYGFSDIPTETVNNSTTVNVEVLPGANGQPGTLADGTQIWKISHNGVDTHPIHFHIFDVQLINRVGWDGQIAMPEPNELGWKDTIKISPLMDTIVAVRPRAPALPFGIPNSLRPLNPGVPIDSAMGFSGQPAGSDWFLGNGYLTGTAIYGFSSIDWTTGQAYPANTPPDPGYPYPNFKGIVTNVLYDFGWEYVWHCHILSHEEMDMMRPIVLKVDTALPPVFSAAAAVNGGKVDISWNDPTPVDYVTVPGGLIASDPESYRNIANEVGFNVYRSTDGVNFTKLNAATLPANSTAYADNTPVDGAIYKVEAFNPSGSTYSLARTITVTAATVGTTFSSPGPVGLTATVANIPAGVTITQVAFYNGNVMIGTDADVTVPYEFSWTNVAKGTYSVTARVTDSQGVVSVSAPITVVVGGTIDAEFTVNGSITPADIGFCESITFASTSPGATGYGWSINGNSYITPSVTLTLPLGSYPVTLTVISGLSISQITKTVNVVNHNPTAVPGGPYSVNFGESVTLNGSGSDPLDLCNTTALTYAWNIDNKGPYDYTGNPTIPYSTLQSALGVGTHTITLKVTDANGGFATATTTLAVNEAPPASISVPAASTNGAYIVTWATVPGLTYTLEEATNAGFTTGNRTVGTGLTAGVADITGRTNNSYYYRVKVDVVGAVSPWRESTNPCVVTLGIPTEILPDFSQPVLTRASQSQWENIVPNALADYFTYVPYTTADAVKLGFPATCGNLAKGDQASTEDCYTITVKKFDQSMAVPGIFGGGPGLRGPDGTPLNAATAVYGYGSGGQNWTPPYIDTTKPGVVAGVTVTGNAPTPFVDGTYGTDGIWHFPAPTIRAVKGRPVRVQWLNELPNEVPTGLDPSVDCGPNAPNCFPYNRIVTHVHGGHTNPESDGLATAWFTPNFAVKGEDFVSTRQHGPEGTYYYPMDQEASTIWYHDHAMGTTHNHTNMGLAGFFTITDDNENALRRCSGMACQPVLPLGNYELGFALQDRHFDTTGKFVMPDYPIYDLTTPGCNLDQTTGLPDDLSCPGGKVLWMKAKDPNNPADTVGHFVPYDAADTATLSNGLNAGAPFGAPSSTLEYFGNMPVVNGVVYGKYNVEPRVYRMRFIGGTDSRAWVMQLKRSDNAAVIPFWVIGSDQGLLNAPVSRNEVDLMPGERIDALVDFSGLPEGTRVMMNNLAGDDPWGGYYDYLAQGQAYPRSLLIPEIMAFDVVPLVATGNIKDPSTVTSLRTPIPAAPAPANTRVVSLMEITDGFGRTMPTIDARGFKPEGIPVTEIIRLNDVEQWDIVNTTVDAHPMHLHQVAFQVIDRQVLTSFTPPVDDIVNQVFTQPTYTVDVQTYLPDAWEAGWKDTVATPPGYVTRVRAKFDLIGDYVWHCHILSHEEHDMMRNFTVVPLDTAGPDPTKAIAPAPASLTVPATSVSGNYTISWVGTAIPDVKYELQEATNPAGPFTTITAVGGQAAPSFNVTGKASGTTHYYKVRALPPVTSNFVTSDWLQSANGVVTTYVVLNPPVSPAQGTQTTLSVTLPPPPTGATVTQVEYFSGATSLGISTLAPYSILWTPATAGAQNLTATVTYSNAETSTSAQVPVVVLAPLPAITWNAPLDGAAFDLGDPVTLTATPADVAGAVISWVAFYDGSKMVGWVDTLAPGSSYSLAYTPLTAGVKSLIARAFYDNGIVTSTVAISVTINGQVIAPASIAVTPAISTTGDYTVSWGASGTTGVTYTLEESNDPTFATNVTTTTNAVSGVAYTNKANATYYYRVVAVKSPMLDSPPVEGSVLVDRPIYAATLTADVPSPQFVGASITFTAAGVLGGTGTAYEYEFWLHDLTSGAWTIAQNYSLLNTFAWDTNAVPAGNYELTVRIRNQGELTYFQVSPVVSYTISSPVPTSGTLDPNNPSPQYVGSTINFVATAQGGTGTPYEFEFWLHDLSSGVWTIAQNYSVSNTLPWNTAGLAAGNYELTVRIRNQGQTAYYQVSPLVSYTINSPVPASGSLDAGTPASPQVKGTSVTFTAGATGGTGTPYEYQFWVHDLTTGVWTVGQNYSTANTFAWDTSTVTAGNYELTVRIRNQGQTAYYQVSPLVSYTINPPVPASGSLDAGTPASPQVKGTSVTFTAGATGGTGTPYEYQFWVHDLTTGVWSIGQDYSTANTFAWNTSTATAGSYELTVRIRNQGQTAYYQVAPLVSYSLL